MCLFIWTLKFVTRYQTARFWNTNGGPSSDSVNYFDSDGQTPQAGVLADAFW